MSLLFQGGIIGQILGNAQRHVTVAFFNNTEHACQIEDAMAETLKRYLATLRIVQHGDHGQNMVDAQ